MPPLPRVMIEERRLIGFLLGATRYGLDILKVHEVVMPAALVPWPSSDPAVLGVFEHRAQVMPVIDVRQRLGLTPLEPTGRTRWIVAQGAGRSVALAVDRVTKVHVFGVGERLSHPEVGGQRETALRCVWRDDQGLVLELDIAELALSAPAVDPDGRP